MATTGVGPLKQALVRALRASTALKAMVGSEGIDEGVSLTGVTYPRVVYSVAMSERIRQFGNEGHKVATVYVWAVSDDPVEANNLDQLILEALDDVELNFTDIDAVDENEPSTLFCRRLRDLSLVELDDAGSKVYQVGGQHQIWLDRL